MEHIQGQVETRTLKYGPAYEAEVAPRSVITLVAEPMTIDASLSLKIGDGAGVHVVLLTKLNQFVVTVEVGAAAQFTLSVLVRAHQDCSGTVTVRLVGPQANVHIQLAEVALESAKTNFVCTLEHVAPRTLGRITARRIVRDAATSSCRGMLRILSGAHGTDTYLSDKAITVGEKSSAKSDPGLEILADDVKASHGATIGRLSDEEMFYLRARGLALPQAEALLLGAFLKPALVGVPWELLKQFDNEISA